MKHLIVIFLVSTFFIPGVRAQQKNCPCEKYRKERLDFETELSFRTYPSFNPDTLMNWPPGRIADSVKSIELFDFDSIPVEFQRFGNVTRLIIIGQLASTKELDLFPKLREVIFEETTVKIGRNEKWPSTIHTLIANKTHFAFDSFRQFRNIQTWRISFSGFAEMPEDFNSMKKLRYYQSGGQIGGLFNLSEIDFKKLPRLKYFEVISWIPMNISGLPESLSGKICTKITYNELTETNKLRLEKIGCN